MRAVVESLEESRIREVANEGLGREGVLKFWFGESDEVTPAFIREAAIASLQAGETFYAHNLGLPELRHAIAGYTHGLHPQQSTDQWFDRVAVTSGGVNGLMLASQALVEAGDEVGGVTPAWPNLVAQPQIMGATVKTVPLKVIAQGERSGAGPAQVGCVPWGTRRSRTRGNGFGAELSRCVRTRRPAHRRPQLFQELPHDRLASGLAGAAQVADPRRGQADRVQHLVRPGLHPARGRGGHRTPPGRDTRAGGTPEALPRHPGAAAAGRARRHTGRAPGRHVRLFPPGGARRLPGHRQTPGARSRPGAGTRQRLRPRGGRLVALVLRQPRPAEAGGGRAAAGKVAGGGVERGCL